MTERELTSEQTFALLFEANSARQLLATGCQLLAADHRIDGKFDALATVWSIGTEKTLKLLLGLAALAEGRPWPKLKDFGHELLEMDRRLACHIESWASTTQQSQWLAGLIRDVQGDPVWPALLRVLDVYARQGRYAYLDRLAEVAEPPMEPRALWPEVEQAVITTRPELSDLVRGFPPAERAKFDAGLLAVNETVTRSLTRWWFTSVRVGSFGAYGAVGRRFATELEPDMALPRLPRHLLPT